MNNIIIDKKNLPIDKKDYLDFCENLKKRVIRILYLKEDVLDNKINNSDIESYITSLIWDLYGAYTVFNEYRFLNCIAELEGIKENLFDDFMRKKTLDLANFISSIPNKK
jgi:arginine deiminase